MPAVLHSLTQAESHVLLQQNASDAHTVASHEQPPQPGEPVLAVQPGSNVVVGQSAGHVAVVSPVSHVPLPQTGAVLLQPALV